ncbi:hypothetical protein HOF56_00150 [Candidatus Peribacteria bacterium]|jgi:hypothetical protein|nr:hypothetical protein [Candidatus Peribacteria bacterium]MBT4020972.1 hypothetical protein [Candidatus Peribacteria bacterium]MBT4240322.1 hypothetical protein [Candidatus Peribacteria bacterium]MBT4474080.1 hypothetical protein [Candidatus Peribacteria bacterium]
MENTNIEKQLGSVEDTELLVSEVDVSNVQDNVANTNEQVTNIVGAEMVQEPTYTDTIYDVPDRDNETKSDSNISNQSDNSEPIQKSSITNSDSSVNYTPHEVTSGVLKSAAGSVAIAGGIGAMTYANTGIAGLALAAPSLVNGAIAGASLYPFGLLHNFVWHKKNGKKPGTLGTMVRGVISPVSVPLGVVRNMTWNRKKG